VRDRANTIIRDRFVFIGFGEEGQELPINAWIVACQPAELTAQATMRLRRLASAINKYASTA
jgi:hypothetical protein